MGRVRRVMERGQPPQAAPYATTPRGYPYPLRSWVPDAAIDIQNLAQALDSDVAGLVSVPGVPACAVSPGIGSQPSGTNTLKGGTATVQGGWQYNTTTGVHTAPKDGFYTFSAWFQVTSASSGWVPLFNLVSGAGLTYGPTVLQNATAIYASLSHTVFMAAGHTATVQLIAYSAALTVNASRVQITRV